MSEDWSDEEFFGYLEIHSRTPRALFSREHAERLLRLAREPVPDDLPAFVCIRSKEAEAFIKKAKFFLNKQLSLPHVT